MGRPPPLMSPAEHQASLALGSSFTSLRGPPHARGLRAPMPKRLGGRGSGRWALCGAEVLGGEAGASAPGSGDMERSRAPASPIHPTRTEAELDRIDDRIR